MRNTLLLLAALVVGTPPIRAQQTPPIQPDCFIPFTFTATGVYPPTVVTGGPGDNRQKGCAAWTLMYQSTGFSGVSVQFNSGASPTTTVSFGSFAGTISMGYSNPLTSTTGGSLQATNGTAVISWVQVAVTLTGGTGTLNGILYGFRNSSAAVNGGGGGGGSGTVTEVDTGCGLAGGPITTMGTLVADGVCVTVPNATMTGTVLNKLAKLTGAPSTAIVSSAGDTIGVIGIVDSGAGTTGSAVVQENGQHSCVFDGATTAGHYVQISASVPGDCTDAGASYPTSGQVIGLILSTNGGAGTYIVDMALGQASVGAGVAVSIPSAPLTIPERDANQNVFANNFVNKTGGNACVGTITLTAASARVQSFDSGSGTCTVVMPDATTLTNGTTFELNMNASTLLTVQANGGGAITAIPAGGYGRVILTSNAFPAGQWDKHFLLPANCPVGTSPGGTTTFLRADCTWAAASGGGTTNQNIRQIGFHFNGQGVALAGTLVGCQRIPYAGTITGWYLDADVAGSATLGVRSVAFASFTGVAGYSGYTDVTGGGTAPIITTSTNATFSNLTSWVTTVTAGQEWCAQLSSPATATVVDLYLQVAAN